MTKDNVVIVDERQTMDQNDEQKIMRDYTVKRKRQIIAVIGAISLLLLLALVYKRPDLFGQLSKKNIVIGQVLVILLFINFSAYNWTCPSCKKYLGNDLNRHVCRKCGARLR
jgi:SNF family Na+-dependent transporter